MGINNIVRLRLMKITGIKNKDLINISDTTSSDDCWTVKLHNIEKMDVLVVAVGNDYYKTSTEDFTSITADLKVAQEHYGLKEGYVLNRSQPDYLSQLDSIIGGLQQVHYIPFQFQNAHNIAESIGDYLSKFDLSTLLHNLITFQIGSDQKPVSKEFLDKLPEQVAPYIKNQTIIDNVRALFFHNCLEIIGYYI